MQTIQLNVSDSIYKQALEHIKSFVSAHQTDSKYEYVDSMGDVIEVVNGNETVIPSKRDIELLSEAFNREDYVSSEEAKKLLLDV